MNFMKPSTFLALGLGASFAFAQGTAQAAWPDHPITIVLPTAAGSSFDSNIRKLGELLGKSLGQPIVVENRPGAGGAIAMSTVARATPDGYTLGVGNTASLAITPELGAKISYDPLSSFTYITRFTHQANILVVRNSLPIKTVAELTAYSKKNPGKLSMGSQGTGSTGHLSGEIYKTLAGADFIHVPYRGGPQAIQDLLGGRIDFLFENTSSIESQVAEGTVRALAVTTSERISRFPDLPTMKEAGVAGFEALSWTALLAPTGTPQAVIDRLKKEVNAVMSTTEFKKFLLDRGTVPDMGTSSEAKAFAVKERAKWREVITQSGASNN